MLEQHIVIPHTTAKAIYDVLLSSELHSALIDDEAVIEPKIGGKTSAFSGYATGEITKLVPGKEIAQTWRASDWTEGHYSHITFKFSDGADGAHITFIQTDLPHGTEAEFEDGWDDFYWQPLREYFA
jgi:activator of HSP90 ATPase